MFFGDVITGLKAGRRYARSGWNGEVIYMSYDSIFSVENRGRTGGELEYHDHIRVQSPRARGGSAIWVMPQSDVLADDWELVLSSGERVPTAKLSFTWHGNDMFLTGTHKPLGFVSRRVDNGLVASFAWDRPTRGVLTLGEFVKEATARKALEDYCWVEAGK